MMTAQGMLGMVIAINDGQFTGEVQSVKVARIDRLLREQGIDQR